MANPTLYGYKILKGTSSTSQTLDLTTLLDPSGAALGPALGGQFTVVHIFVASNTDRNPAATGYTNFIDAYVNSTNDTMLWAGYKFQPSTPDTTITITGSTSSGSSLIAIATVWDNVDPTTPLDGVAAVNASSTTTALPDPGSITPTTTDAVFLFGAGNASTVGTSTISQSYMDWSVADSRNGSFDASVLVGYKTGGVASTPYDGAALTWSGTDNTAYSNASTVIVLKPTAGADVSVTPSVGVVSVAGLAPSVAAGVSVTPSAGTVAVAGFAPSVVTGVAVVPSAGAVSVTGFAPSVSIDVAVTPDTGGVSVVGFDPDVSAGAPPVVVIDAGDFVPTRWDRIFRDRLLDEFKDLVEEILEADDPQEAAYEAVQAFAPLEVDNTAVSQSSRAIVRALQQLADHAVTRGRLARQVAEIQAETARIAAYRRKKRNNEAALLLLM